MSHYRHIRFIIVIIYHVVLRGSSTVIKVILCGIIPIILFIVVIINYVIYLGL